MTTKQNPETVRLKEISFHSSKAKETLSALGVVNEQVAGLFVHNNYWKLLMGMISCSESDLLQGIEFVDSNDADYFHDAYEIVHNGNVVAFDGASGVTLVQGSTGVLQTVQLALLLEDVCVTEESVDAVATLIPTVCIDNDVALEMLRWHNPRVHRVSLGPEKCVIALKDDDCTDGKQEKEGNETEQAMETKQTMETKPVIRIRMDEGAWLPAKAHEWVNGVPGDAGYDVKVLSVETEKIEPAYGCRTGWVRVKISTGIHAQPPVGYRLMAVPNSRVTKTGFVMPNSPGTIDANYRGDIKFVYLYPYEVFDNYSLTGSQLRGQCNMHTSVNDNYRFAETYVREFWTPGTVCGQLILVPDYDSIIQVQDELDETSRGAGGFGSSVEKSKNGQKA